MADIQHSLITDQFTDDLLEHIDDVPEVIRNKWPKDLAALCDIYAHELKIMGYTPIEAQKISMKLMIAQANYGGGRMFYLPKGDRLRQAIRDHQIYAQFNGANIDHLAKQNNLTVQRIYEIIKHQRDIERARVQPTLF